MQQPTQNNAPEGRKIVLGQGAAAIPEELLLAHAKGEVLFITGAGISKPAGLPDFKELVLELYKCLDQEVYAVLERLPEKLCPHCPINLSDLRNDQAAEVKRFAIGDYDIALGMLERRIHGRKEKEGIFRKTLAKVLRKSARPADTHRALIRLADRGEAVTIVTTNFDLLLEKAARKNRPPVQSYGLAAIPRPTRDKNFSGILHIHGALDSDPERCSDFIITDQDFGEYYLRRRQVSDFIYDSARLFHLVLVGYSANDAPMRYLLNAVAADSIHYSDLKTRFSFVGSTDPIERQDWESRGITPISYRPDDGHIQLCDTLRCWATLSDFKTQEAEIKRIAKKKRQEASGEECDLFDHLIRRCVPIERSRLLRTISQQKADIGWLDAIVTISMEK